ncbi:hypothetical protein R1sor_002626 [Riccia sorocarpa]|uniref:Reverse transcriptase domain-containing protein n=1 Tax=Riccia sorocarpa TaxID=122646 RepID=A0ABD3H5E5_9MARC
MKFDRKFIALTKGLVEGSISKIHEAQGNLKGLRLSATKTALYNLYVDDLGVFISAEPDNLLKLQETIKVYEDISGACLNLEKFIIILVVMDSTPAWLNCTGCYIANEGGVIRYLGFPIGWKLIEAHRYNFLLGRMEKKLRWWAYKLLTFEGRLTVLRHILRNIPNHLLVIMTLSTDNAKNLEGICRKFTWEKNSDGKDKIPLISWEDIHCAKG